MFNKSFYFDQVVNCIESNFFDFSKNYLFQVFQKKSKYQLVLTTDVKQGEPCLYLSTKNYQYFCFSSFNEIFLICVGTMEMALDYDGARFLGCNMLCFCCFHVEHGCYQNVGWSFATEVGGFFFKTFNELNIFAFFFYNYCLVLLE